MFHNATEESKCGVFHVGKFVVGLERVGQQMDDHLGVQWKSKARTVFFEKDRPY